MGLKTETFLICNLVKAPSQIFDECGEIVRITDVVVTQLVNAI